VPSHRPYVGLGELDYPLHDWASTVTTCGRICFRNRKVNLSQVFAGQQVGVRQVDEHLWLVTFMHPVDLFRRFSVNAMARVRGAERGGRSTKLVKGDGVVRAVCRRPFHPGEYEGPSRTQTK